jgi:glyoxylase-like metal-dependent hydrolase (beta-lactamase superfamily II)
MRQMVRASGSNARGIAPKLLLLTHGHFDHVPDVAKIKRRFSCEVGCHAMTVPMISDPNFFRDFGFALEIEPAEPDFLIEATPSREFLGLPFEVLEVPGHSPDSICFLRREDQLLIGGDVLFAGGVGRWDLPGGDGELLFRGIKSKLFPLGDEIAVLPATDPRQRSAANERPTHSSAARDQPRSGLSLDGSGLMLPLKQ